jgi:hypothetical protein
MPVAVVGATVAVNVSGDPYVDGFADEASVTIVPAWFTVCVSVGEMLALSLGSPPYEAVIELDPTASIDVL